MKFDSAAAATIDVSRWRRTTTVMAEMASTIRQLSATPPRSAPARTPPTVMTTPAKAIRLAISVRHVAASPSHSHASAAATKGWVAISTATFMTLVI